MWCRGVTERCRASVRVQICRFSNKKHNAYRRWCLLDWRISSQCLNELSIVYLYVSFVCFFLWSCCVLENPHRGRGVLSSTNSDEGCDTSTDRLKRCPWPLWLGVICREHGSKQWPMHHCLTPNSMTRHANTDVFSRCLKVVFGTRGAHWSYPLWMWVEFW
jgi:hypothetical protein